MTNHPQEHSDPQRNEAKSQLCLHTDMLFKNGQEVLIQHGKEVYRLRLTRSGKLILNK